MDLLTWAAIGGAALFVLLLGVGLVYLAPARTTIVVDTVAATARADMRVLWGAGPILSARALPREGNGEPLPHFNDIARIGYALMTPGIADVAYSALRELLNRPTRVAHAELGLNLGDASRNLVVQTAVQAAFAAAPARIRDIIAVTKCEAPGAELRGSFEIDASPAELSGIWSRFRSSRAAREFRRRLKRKPKVDKKAPREVRTA
jgi:hypothetical protein